MLVSFLNWYLEGMVPFLDSLGIFMILHCEKF